MQEEPSLLQKAGYTYEYISPELLKGETANVGYVDGKLVLDPEGQLIKHLANEDWASGNYEGFYTLQQFIETLEFCVENRIELPSPFDSLGDMPEGVSIKEAIIHGLKEFASPSQPDEGIAVWPILAHNW